MLLCGCAAQTYETLGEITHVSSTLPPMGQTVVQFPDDAVLLTSSDGNSIYTCNDYTITMQVFPAGNLQQTISSLCGFEPSQLTLMESQCKDHARYEWVWTAAGENGDAMCRAAVLDDGKYHYSLCVVADAKDAGNLTQVWNELFASFCLESDES